MLRRRGGSPLANHKSAKKRARQDLKRRDRNRSVKSRVATSLKQAQEAIQGSEKPEDKQHAVRSAERELRKAASKGVLPAKRVSRLVSRLAKRANA